MGLKFLHQSMEQRREMILGGSMASTLAILSVPTLMMSVVQSMMPLTDGLFINNISGMLVASAVTYSTPIINMMIAISQGLSIAAMAIIGQANGKGDADEIRHTSTQVVAVTFLMGIICAPLLALIAIPISGNVNAEIAHNVFLYLALYALVLPFAFMESVYNAIKNATGKPEATFIRMVIMLLLKILFNFVFIYWLRLGIVGSVLASLGANMVVCFWMFHELFIAQSESRLSLKGFRFDKTVLKQLFRVGIPSILTSVMLNFGFYLINNEIQKYGPVVLNGQGIANSIIMVCFNVPSSFGSAVTTTVSMNIGAGLPGRAKKFCLAGGIASVTTAMLLIAAIVPLSPHLTVWFTHKQEVLQVANQALPIYAYSVIGFGICMVVQGAMIGMGRTRVPMIVGFLRIWLFRYIFILATERFLSYSSVFWGNMFSNTLAAVVSVIIIMRVPWRSVIQDAEMKKRRKLEGRE